MQEKQTPGDEDTYRELPRSAGMRGDVQAEWDGTKQHDVVFLLTIDPPDTHTLQQLRKDAEAAGGTGAKPSPDKLHGLVRVRGCEVVEVPLPFIECSHMLIPIVSVPKNSLEEVKQPPLHSRAL